MHFENIFIKNWKYFLQQNLDPPRKPATKFNPPSKSATKLRPLSKYPNPQHVLLTPPLHGPIYFLCKTFYYANQWIYTRWCYVISKTYACVSGKRNLKIYISQGVCQLLHNRYHSQIFYIIRCPRQYPTILSGRFH